MALSEETMSKCSVHLSAYKSACEDHPELKSFNLALQERANKVIDSLTTGAETGTGYLSQHEIHMEVSKHLFEVSQDVANFIIESENNVWESKALNSLVTAYFENTLKTLEIFDNVMDCVEKAEIGRLYIQEAVAQFEKESAENDVGGKKKRYEKTLEKLKKFKAMGDPFDGRELTNQFKLIQKQQESLLQEVSEAKTKLDEEVKKLAEEYAKAQKQSKLANVLFGATFCIVAVGSIALIASGVGAPLGIVGVVSLPVIAVGWVGVHTFLESRMDALKRQQEALARLNENLSSVEHGIVTNERAIENISEQVHHLEKKITSLLKLVDEAIEDEGDEVDTKLALHLIRDKVTKLTETLKEIGETVDKLNKLIREARLHVLEKISGSVK
ncbi:PREDICTED: UPF0496 protein At3g28270-like [Camelina sativa]|uniref:UPF0496 protein At3g28270-like n=1 Tax=Camelina sativa TaxID=90675 RepID=A0ABM0YLH4_CAMSA|nr:PREDICTED: UPF0496 protein At3g28270-like [Camelina sativa]